MHPRTTASNPRQLSNEKVRLDNCLGFELGAMRACVRREGSRCEKTEEDTEQPIAAPACPSYGTRLSLRDLCVVRAVRAVGSGFRRGAERGIRLE